MARRDAPGLLIRWLTVPGVAPHRSARTAGTSGEVGVRPGHLHNEVAMLEVALVVAASIALGVFLALVMEI